MPARFYVRSNSGNDSNTGGSWNQAFATLQQALVATAASTAATKEIWVAAGTYYPDEGGNATDNDRAAAFIMQNNLAIYGGFAGTETQLSERDIVNNITILSGDIDNATAPDDYSTVPATNIAGNSSHVIFNDSNGLDATAVLDGFTIRGGNETSIDFPNNTGGGIFNRSSSPTLTNCNFTGNQANFGGGMSNISSTPTVSNCTFSGNRVGNSGGGMYNSNSSPMVSNCTFSGNQANNNGGGMHNSSSSPTLTSCTFSGNQANVGGGMYNSGFSSPTLINCTFNSNQANSNGGGMQNIRSSPTLTNCTFRGNSALFGGGIENARSTPTLTNCTFNGNQASNNGGGISNENSSPTLLSCTVSGNHAERGGGIYINASAPALTNCIIWNNRDQSGTGTASASINNDNSTSTITYSLVQNITTAGTDNNLEGISTAGDANYPQFIAPVDPATAPTTNGDFRLQVCSPAVNAGDNSANNTTTDLAGNARVFNQNNGGLIDLGAYESSVNPFAGMAGIVYVNGNAPVNSQLDGSSWANAYRNLQDALAVAGCTGSGITQIWVAASTYYPDEGGGQTNDDRSASFVMQNNLAIYGGFSGTETQLSQRDIAANATILSGDIDNATDPDDYSTVPATGIEGNSYHVVLNDQNGLDNTVILDGLTISGGNANGNSDVNGGGMYNRVSSATITNCTFINNSARTRGGGMFNSQSSISLINCTFANDSTVGSGGAMYNSSSNTTITSCTFAGNSAGAGGALLNEVGSPMTLTMIDCTITNNLAQGSGGGIHDVSSSSNSLVLDNCMFNGNSAGSGGGIRLSDGSSPSLVNCTFVNNSATSGSGGGILVRSESDGLVFINCTFINNFAQVDGGGMKLERSPVITNCIINNNTDQSGTGTANANIGLSDLFPIINHSLVQGVTTGGSNNNLDGSLDPLFVDAANGDVRLLPCSPAINMGDNNANNTTTDLAGNPRIFNQNNGGVIDLGAYEFQGSPYTGTAGIVYVNQNAPNTSNVSGSDWTNAYHSLQDALDLARCNANVTQIWVAAGTYYPDEGNGRIDNDRSASFVMQNNLAIYGGFAGTETQLSQRDIAANETILSGDIDHATDPDDYATVPATGIDGNSLHIIFNNQNGLDDTAILDGFTIRGGNANATTSDINTRGGGMYNHTSSPTVTNCIYTHNWAQIAGAAILNFRNTSVITHSTFTNNLAQFGGAIRNCTNTSTITDCTFTNNLARFGGAISNDNLFSQMLTNCTFIDNRAQDTGGGVSNGVSSPLLINCTFRNNSAILGGGMHDDDNSLSTSINCVFVGNSAQLFGGGVRSRNSDASPVFTNCTFTNNSAQSSGGGIEARVRLILTNCILWNNVDQSGTGTASANINSSSSDFSFITYSLVQGITTGNSNNNLAGNLDPLFVDAANGDVRLRPCSPAVNAGDNSANNTTIDLVGNIRIQNSTIDLGAYENPLDTENPVITNLPNLTANTAADGTGNCSTTRSWTHPALMDNVNFTDCPPQSFTYTLSGATIQAATNVTSFAGTQAVTATFNTGVTIVTYNATDAVGNNAMAKSFTVTVTDNEPPTFTIPLNRDLNVNENCEVIIPNLVSEVTDAADNCAMNPTVTQNPTANTAVALNHNQTTQVQITVADGNGNSTVKNVTLTAKDNTRPNIQTNPHTVTLNSNGTYTLTANDLAILGAGTTDNCSAFSQLTFIATPNTFNCADVGTRPITLVATDAVGNESVVANANLTINAPPSTFSFLSNIETTETDENTTVTITVNRSNPICAANLDFITQNVTAVAGSDYTAQNGTLNFATGENTQTITLAIIGDTEAENSETFRLRFSNPTANHNLPTNRIVVTILDDDSANTVMDFDGVDDKIVVENLEVTQGFTLEMWVNYAGQQANNEAIFSHNNNTFFFGFDQGHLRLFGTDIQTNQPFPTNVWKHIALTINNSGRVGGLYVDGVLVGSEFPLRPEHQASIARGIFGLGTGLAGMKGKMDEIRLWNDVRSFSELEESRNCELTGDESELVFYLDFNEGSPNGDNTNLNSLTDRSGNYTTQLMGFDLIGLQSNLLKSELDLITNCPTALAIDDIQLTAETAVTGVQLAWTVATITDIQQFSLERSFDGKNYATIQTLVASDRLHYDFFDASAPYGKPIYYRIVAQTTNGNLYYSNLQRLKIAPAPLVSVAPNPTTGNLTIKSEAKLQSWQIYDALGRLIQQSVITESTNESNLNLNNQAAGIYVIQIQTEQSETTQKIILQR